MPSSECLPEECIAELVEGRLKGDALAAAEAHLVTCIECRSLVTSMANAVGSTAPSDEAGKPGDPASGREPPILQRNDRVARYVIQGLVGAGGMGRVYAAHDPSLDRTVALKLLRPDVAIPDLESRLLREAKAMARISHPHVIAVHDAGRHGEQVYIAMEFVEGGTLREWQRRAPHTWREVLDVYLRAGEGLAEAHAAGIIHRDFKPDNVLVGDNGRVVRVTDFGLARAAPSDSPVSLGEADTRLAIGDSSSLDSNLTRTGALVGTPVYMAPEQHSAEIADARSDIYAYCIALYEALYGERPFSGNTLLALHAAKLANKVGLPKKDAAKRVPQRIRRVLLAGLDSDPSRRPQSMALLIAALRQAARRPRLPFVAAGGVLLGAAAWTVYAAGAHGGERSRVAASGAAASAAAMAAPLCSNRKCAADHGGEPWVCRAEDHQCVPVANADCKAYFEPGDLESDDTIWLGALFPMTGPIADVGKTNVQAVDLARREFAHATRSLTGPNASLRVRRVAVAMCDDANGESASRAAEHLVTDVGVPAIMGFRSGQEVMDLTGSLLIQKNVVSIATLSPSPLITQIPHPGNVPRMVWRTTFSMGGVAAATAGFIHDYFEPRRSAATGPTRVTLLRGSAPGAVAFGQALLKSLTFNGKNAVENRDLYQEMVLPDVAVRAEDYDQISRVADRAVAAAPTFVVLQTHPSVFVRLLETIELRWKRAAPRPVYLLAGDAVDQFSGFVGRSAERRRRVFGVVSASTSAANAHFVIRFNEAYENHVSRTENPGSSYDAFYMLAFAASAVGRDHVTGAGLAGAFERLVPPGRAIEVGPTGAFEALAELATGRAIDLEGATSTLDFDTTTGETALDYALVCSVVNANGTATGESVESGLAYRATTRHADGVLSCP